jgi:hypothetical protein
MGRCPHAQTIEAMSYDKGLPSTGRPERRFPRCPYDVAKNRLGEGNGAH